MHGFPSLCFAPPPCGAVRPTLTAAAAGGQRYPLPPAGGARGRLAPQLLEPVELPRLRGEDVHDDVEVVDQDPAARREPSTRRGSVPCSCLSPARIPSWIALAWRPRVARADQEPVGVAERRRAGRARRRRRLLVGGVARRSPRSGSSGSISAPPRVEAVARDVVGDVPARARPAISRAGGDALADHRRGHVERAPSRGTRRPRAPLATRIPRARRAPPRRRCPARAATASRASASTAPGSCQPGSVSAVSAPR